MQFFRLFPRTRQQWQTIAIVIGLGLLFWQVWTVQELNGRLDSIESTVRNIESDVSVSRSRLRSRMGLTMGETVKDIQDDVSDIKSWVHSH